MEGFANQQGPDIPLSGKVLQLLEIGSDTRALKCFNALRSDSKFITNGKANSLSTDIEREYTGARLAHSRKLIVSIQIVQLRIIEAIT